MDMNFLKHNPLLVQTVLYLELWRWNYNVRTALVLQYDIGIPGAGRVLPGD